MGNINALGITYDYTEIRNLAGKIYNITAARLHHDILGDIIFLDDVDKELHFHERKEEFYKYRSVIYEQKLMNKIVLVCKDKQSGEWLNKLGEDAVDFQVFEKSEFLNSFPQTIADKKRRIILNLYHISSDYGKKIEILAPELMFAKDKDDVDFFSKIMKKDNLIDFFNPPNWLPDDCMYKRLMWVVSIGENGWRLIEEEQKLKRNQAFVAMSFSKELENIGSAIMQAIHDSGFDAIKVNEKQFNSDITGQILFDIKHSRFIVADVTQQKQGVYFEAGFAMGNNIPVIWTCKEEEIKDVHFDTNHYNHILWKSPDDLYKRLKDRIKGTILLND